MAEDTQQLRQTRVVFLGTPAFALPSLQALADAGAQIVGVVTQPDKPTGRGQKMQGSAVGERAAELGLPVWKPKGLKHAENRKWLEDLQPDLLVVVAYGNILPKRVLDLPKFGAVNVHASLLPQYRGPSPIPAAILAGDAETGVTIMKLDEGMDTGPLLAQERLPIAPQDTAATLAEKLAVAGARLLMPTLKRFLAGKLSPTPQDHARATICPMLKKEDGLTNWNRPAVEIERLTRAYDPWPRAYTIWNGKRLILRRVTRRDGVTTDRGVVFRAAGEINVTTGSGVLVLQELQLEGRAPMTAKAFAQGRPDFVGSVLGPATAARAAAARS